MLQNEEVIKYLFTEKCIKESHLKICILKEILSLTQTEIRSVRVHISSSPLLLEANCFPLLCVKMDKLYCMYRKKFNNKLFI